MSEFFTRSSHVVRQGQINILPAHHRRASAASGLRHHVKERTTCSLSINPSPAFAPFDVPLPDFHGIYRVLACIIFH